ncbi:MAG: DUF1553 domain-containing protein [Planctomycetaceae bacterium]|nr:DUF1553 domain-containing protein [Planctomycetaceae bacterium]
MRIISMLLILVLTSVANATEPISFNKHIRPILTDRCFTCHGPDAATREAKLRLDIEQHATAELPDTGNVAIVPGNLPASELVARITDPDQRMPPPESNLKLSTSEIELLKRWIREGAKWERHWAFIAPTNQPKPQINQQHWPINEIDTFVLQELETNNLPPAPAASRQRWLRRVTFDLTGLPPTLAEIDLFENDNAENAFERVVDRLLNSPAYGERMATEWLDVARYGDTDGLFEDHERSIYPWRDWVVEAFNSNLPYDDFITWQIAGDLLPAATVAQQTATGFLRNNPTSNEGGIIQEDYRVKYLVDRVNTTATAMLGLTLKCAQCHDHKYDPMTQREYYQFAGFFNSLVGNGNTKGATAPILRSLTSQQTRRIAAINSELETLKTTVETSPPALLSDFQEWLDNVAKPIAWKIPTLIKNEHWILENQWFVAINHAANSVDPLPKQQPQPQYQGRYVRISHSATQTQFLTMAEVQVFSNDINIAPSGKATQSSHYPNSPASKAIDGNHNGSFATCSCTTEQRGAWWELDLGKSIDIDSVTVWNRTDCCPERLDNISIEILDEQRQVIATRTLKKSAVRNTLPAGAAQPSTEPLETTLTFNVAAGELTALQFQSNQTTQIEILAMHIHTAGNPTKPTPLKLAGNTKITLQNSDTEPVILAVQPPHAITAKQQLALKIRFNKTPASGNPLKLKISVSDDPLAATKATLPKESAEQLKQFKATWTGFSTERKRQTDLTAEKKKIDAAASVTMVAGDIAAQRTNFLLLRGEYDQRGEELTTAALGSILPYEEDLPKNRLGLAAWLTNSNNPLTGRVAVNRYWQMLFGTGIVKTSEDFGTQGDQPSHQALLDHLTANFITSGWDVKALLRDIVLSATYRQTSRRSANLTQIDPSNRLLAHGPRQRLPAEFLRDHVLSTSGLIVNQQGGPGVHPYQPAEMFGVNAIGSQTAKFTVSTGSELYRRSLYTYWKRQIPAANIRILGADGRTACRTRRAMTNTPLQALVTLNDPQFVEAARVLGERMIREGGDAATERIEYAFRLATSRRATNVESGILLAEFQDRLREFVAAPELAKQYLAGGGQRPAPADLEPSELAAYAAVSSLILNLDESMSK